MMRRLPAICLSLCLLFLAGTAAFAQSYPVTAGEHAGFTRVVIHAPPGITWQMDADGTERQIIIEPAGNGFDLTRLFDRISRDRLENATTEGGHLTLSLTCACETEVWEERAGLIVMDIRAAIDPPAQTDVPQNMPQTPPVAALNLSEIAPTSGAAVAQRLSAALAPATTLAEPPLPAAADLALQLAGPVAQALTQGVLEPATNPPTPPAALLTAAPPGVVAIENNLQISVVTDRQIPDTSLAALPTPGCEEAGTLSFLLTNQEEPFGATFGRLTRELYGEFDQPDTAAWLALVQLYLSSGFGAEARALIANGPDPLLGRDLLLGLSDVFEGRNTNSRLRLAQYIDCGGPAALFAALAGAEIPETSELGASIALTFIELPAPLRAIIGRPLAQNLIEAGSLDAARIIIDATHRSEWLAPDETALVSALLDQARGFPDEAAARLRLSSNDDPATILARLELAADRGGEADNTLLQTAETLAETERNNDLGFALMAALVRLRLMHEDFANAASNLDRLRNWSAGQSAVEQPLVLLRDSFWAQLANNATDLTLLQYALARDGWRSTDLSERTRRRVAERFLALGLGTQALALTGNSEAPEDVLLSAQAYIILGDAEAALEALETLDSATARAVRARALILLGQSDQAARALSDAGSPQDAAVQAIRAQNWALLADLPGDSTLQTGVERTPVAEALASAPGYLDPPPAQNTTAGTDVADEENNTQAIDIGTSTGGTQPNGLELPAQLEDRISEPETNQPELQFDFSRLGLISRSETLLGESARLRRTLAPLTTLGGATE